MPDRNARSNFASSLDRLGRKCVRSQFVSKSMCQGARPAVAREIVRRLDLAGDELPSSLEGFIERHLGPERQLTLRLALRPR